MVTIKNCSLLLVLGLLCSGTLALGQTSTNATPLPKNPHSSGFNLELATSLKEKSFSNEAGEKSLQLAVAIDPRAKFTISPELHIFLEPVFNFASSNITTRFGDNNYGNRVFLYSAYVNYNVAQIFDFRAGAINQDYFENSLFLSSWRSFPGLMEIATLKFDESELSIIFQQSVPTSESFASDTVSAEEFPTFFTETLKAKLAFVKGFELEPSVTLYSFNDLPAKVAYDSSVYGNLTNDYPTPNNAKFRYDFYGWIVGLKGNVSFANNSKIKAGAMVMENMAAPLGINQGQLAFAAVEAGITPKFSIEPRFEIFFNEAATVPALYNSADYGHNNRQGWSAGLDLNFKNPNFSIKTYYIEANALNDLDTNLTKQHFLGVALETKYDVL